MHRHHLKHVVVPAAIVVSTLIKYCVGIGSYSGHNTPPMFGDYEAQRHWMELTIHLPVSQWYTYDLQYWGLDYPPLTAYVSWLCGIIGTWIEPSWFAFESSRGMETEGSKLYLRATVLILDALVYVPALVMFTQSWHGTRSRRTRNTALLTLLLQPTLLLIDFGHFQYNSVMLGLTLMALDFFVRGRDLLGAVCFVLSLGFKQMALYYAPAVGGYLLAKCLVLGPQDGRQLFLRLAGTTLLSFFVLFIPFLPPFGGVSSIMHPITRIFPFARGVFEDKVANFWCASNVVFKWRAWAAASTLVKLSAILTAGAFAPAVTLLLRTGLRRSSVTLLSLLPYALLSTSMAFFLFSFQVHEKTILVPLLPLTLLLSGANPDSDTFAWGALVNNVAAFSMWPLLRRDGLGVQYIALQVLWNRLIGYNPFSIKSPLLKYFSFLILVAILGWHVSELCLSPPARYPDVFPVINVLISTPVFGLTLLWSILCMLRIDWA
ncbi:ALG6, ALG8 glycosyltransferase, partial [Fistulina hepatica ATCC 64428]